MTDLSGSWQIDITFIVGTARHAMQLQQQGGELTGRYRSQFGEEEVCGVLQDGAIQLHTAVRYQHCGTGMRLEGTVSGDTMAGTVDLGEYWQARWEARRAG